MFICYVWKKYPVKNYCANAENEQNKWINKRILAHIFIPFALLKIFLGCVISFYSNRYIVVGKTYTMTKAKAT